MLGLSAVCCEEVTEWNASRAQPTCFSGQPRRGDRKCHLSHRPPHCRGRLRGHSTALTEKPEPGGSSYLHWSQKTGSDLPKCPRHPRLLPPWLLSWAFSKLLKDALELDTVPGYRKMSGRLEGWGPWNPRILIDFPIIIQADKPPAFTPISWP